MQLAVKYNLEVDANTFALIWAALGEMPAKHSFGVLENLKQQVEAQEAKILKPDEGASDVQG